MTLISPINIDGTFYCINSGYDGDGNWRTESVFPVVTFNEPLPLTTTLSNSATIGGNGDEINDSWNVVESVMLGNRYGMVKFGVGCGVSLIRIALVVDVDRDVDSAFVKIYLNGVIIRTILVSVGEPQDYTVDIDTSEDRPCGHIIAIEGYMQNTAGSTTSITAAATSL